MAIEKETNSNIKAGQVRDLATLVEYSEGAVVSRTLIEKDAGMVTMFAFDKNQGLSEHTVPFDALVQVLEGEGEFIIGGTSHRVGEAQMLVMPATIPHAVRATTRFRMVLTMLRT